MDHGRIQRWLLRSLPTHTQESTENDKRSVRQTIESDWTLLIDRRFPLANYIVGVERNIRPPWYLQKQPMKDLSVLYPGTGSKYSHVDILDGQWPDDPTMDLDASQVAALRRILRKELAVVQGPPGTGTLQPTRANELSFLRHFKKSFG